MASPLATTPNDPGAALENLGVRQRANRILENHISQAIIALLAQGISPSEKIERVMAILGRVVPGSPAPESATAAPVRQVRQAEAIKPAVIHGHELMPMAVFQIGCMAHEKSGGDKVFRFIPASPIYFERKKTDSIAPLKYQQF